MFQDRLTTPQKKSIKAAMKAAAERVVRELGIPCEVKDSGYGCFAEDAEVRSEDVAVEFAFKKGQE